MRKPINFIGYLDDDYNINPLHILLPKTSVNIKGCDSETKWMHLLTENDELLKTCNDIWEKGRFFIRRFQHTITLLYLDFANTKNNTSIFKTH